MAMLHVDILHEQLIAIIALHEKYVGVERSFHILMYIVFKKKFMSYIRILHSILSNLPVFKINLPYLLVFISALLIIAVHS